MAGEWKRSDPINLMFTILIPRTDNVNSNFFKLKAFFIPSSKQTMSNTDLTKKSKKRSD